MARRASKVRTTVAIAVLATTVLGAAGYVASEKARPLLIAGPMVHIPGPDAVVVSWRARTVFSGGWVTFRRADGSETVVEARRKDERYEADLDGLPPGTEVHYSIFNEGLFWRRVLMSGPHPASAPPPRGRAFRFVAFGDSGIGNNAQANVVEQIVRQAPDLVIHTGDLVYPAGAAKDYRRAFYEPNAALICSVPFMPCLGNHDVATEKGRALLDTFVLPANGPPGIEAERCYYFDFGDARFVALDTNAPLQGGTITVAEMKTIVAPWLRRVLTDCDARWRFVYFHEPFYTGSEHAPAEAAYIKEAFVGIFESCGVDLVFCGHNHLYERTAPIREDRVVPEGQGVVYITTGAGGGNRYAEILPAPDYMRVHNGDVFSFTQIDLRPDRLALKQIDDSGNVIDEYVIEKPPPAVSAAPVERGDMLVVRPIAGRE